MYLPRTLILLLGLSFFACSDRASFSEPGLTWESKVSPAEVDRTLASRSESLAQSASTAPRSPTIPTERQIIHRADVRAEVLDLAQATAQIKRALRRHQAYLAQEEYTSSHQLRERDLTIRVPRDHFFSLLDTLAAETHYLLHQNVRAQDVTEEFVDLQTRLRTKRAARDRYIEVLRTRANTAEELLLAEDKIRVIQEEIEAQEGRLQYLQNQVALSTIQLHLFEKRAVASGVGTPPLGRQVLDAIARGWSSLRYTLIFVVAGWPYWLVLLLLFWGWRRWRQA
ncbi:MAG: DUF4349 domain-containing protein [Bacteroidota bacterium]